MDKFRFKAKDWNGKIYRGVMEAASRQVAIESVRNNGLVPLEVEVESQSSIGQFLAKISGRVTSKQMTAFTRQLSTMMTAGLPLTDALSLLLNQQEGKGQLSEIIQDCLNAVRGGQSLGDALEKYQDVFGEAYVASIRAGEEGGVLEEVLNKLAQNREGEDAFQGKVKGAMIYPAIVMVGMLAVMFIMMVFVLPKLTSLYADFGNAKMPVITVAMMSLSAFMVKFWFLFPAIPAGIYMATGVINRNPDWLSQKDKIIFKIPIIGGLMKKSIIANTARTLSMLLTAGIPLVKALKIVSSVSGNELFRRAYIKIAEKTEKGFSVADAFAEHDIFPMIVNQMVTTGEATGKLDEVLMKVSDYFSTEAEQEVGALTAAMEPLIMIVLGIGVAFLVVAVIMPIYDLTSQF